MFTRTRADGTSYMVSGRNIYIASGRPGPRMHRDAEALLRRFDDLLHEGRSPEEAAAVFTTAAKAPALRAARLIRQFEALVGCETGAEVIGLDTSRSDDSELAVQNRGGCTFPPEAADLADQTARALAEVLGALGLERVGIFTID